MKVWQGGFKFLNCASERGENVVRDIVPTRCWNSRGRHRGVKPRSHPKNEELVAGFWIWKVKLKQEALEWAKRCPSPFPGEECEIEIRQVFEAEDFITPDSFRQAAKK